MMSWHSKDVLSKDDSKKGDHVLQVSAVLVFQIMDGFYESCTIRVILL